MELVKLELHHVAYFEEYVPNQAFTQLVHETEEQLFKDGLYKNGPTVIETQFSTFGQAEGKHLFKIYVPVNEQIEDNKHAKYLGDFTVEKAAMIRSPFTEDLGVAMKKLKDFMELNKLDLEEDKLYLVMMYVFDEYWVDLLLPYKEES